MPLRNRVAPTGELIADPARGLVYGNRGCLHDVDGRIRRPFAVKRWIACRLRYKDWHRGPLLQPGRFTELFFLDEATAFAAGHRPCALCRSEDYRAFVASWEPLHPADHGADAIDDRLHGERWDPSARTRRLHRVRARTLPDGAFVLLDGEPWVVVDDRLARWTPGGYVGRVARPTRGDLEVVTPSSILAVLRTARAPAVPFLHPSAYAPSRARRGRS
ncbi:MAG TPA: hypothetical protein VIE12_01285 [Actinomycetota bacterium]